MGIKLMVEVMDHWQDAGLTPGERADLLVLAENASDESRETYPKGGVHQPYILRRVGKTAGGWKNAIGKLMNKGVLNYAVRDGRDLSGHPGQVAVYRLVVLCPEAPHDGLRGQCTRPERVTSQVTLSKEGAQGMGHLSGDPNKRLGHLSDAEWVTSQVTPTPPYSSGTTSSLSSGPPAPPEGERETIADASKPTTRLTAAQKAVRGVVPTEDEPAFIAWVTAECRVRTPAFWRTAADDMPELAQTWLAKRATDRQRASPPAPDPMCRNCGTHAPAACTVNGRAYCPACTTTCDGCQQPAPADDFDQGHCLDCQRSSAA